MESVTLLVRGEALRASHVIQQEVLAHPRIDVRFHTVVEGFEGASAKLHTVRVRDLRTGQVEALPVPGAFIFIGLDPNTAFLRGSGVRLDAGGFVITGHDLVHDGDLPPGFAGREPAPFETAVPGIFAAGDVRTGSTKQVATAAGERRRRPRRARLPEPPGVLDQPEQHVVGEHRIAGQTDVIRETLKTE